MSDLVDRLEAAAGPDRELDEAIIAWSQGAERVEDATFDHKHGYARDGFWVSIGPIHPVTASIDAALALVERLLPGWTIQIFQLRRNKGWGARISSPRYDTFSSFEDDAHVSDDGFVGQSSGALALLVALLRARASLQDKGGTA